MKAKWKNDEIKSLFKIIENGQTKNLPIMQGFKEFGKLTNRNPLSVRNFYYAEVKLLKDNLALQKEIGVDISKHSIQKFEHFDNKSENELKNKIDKLKSKGCSIRRACFELSNGDITEMLRIQNKYRNIQNKQKNEKTQCEATVIEFPKSKTTTNPKNKLTDDDIKSLFMGLVKLVKENANSDSQEKAERFLEETEKQNRKRLVEIEQMQNEIAKLKQTIDELNGKNRFLNTQLENYRMNFVCKNPQTDNAT